MKLWSVFPAIAAALWLLAGSDACAAEDENLGLLLDAIARVESHNDRGAVGDGGGALGVYQIHRAYWEDGTRILGVRWKYVEAKDPLKARQVVRAYLCHYGKGKSLIDLARIHNGGPRGDEKRATLEYAHRVQAIMNRLAQPSRGDPAPLHQ